MTINLQTIDGSERLPPDDDGRAPLLPNKQPNFQTPRYKSRVENNAIVTTVPRNDSHGSQVKPEFLGTFHGQNHNDNMMKPLLPNYGGGIRRSPSGQSQYSGFGAPIGGPPVPSFGGQVEPSFGGGHVEP